MSDELERVADDEIDALLANSEDVIEDANDVESNELSMDADDDFLSMDEVLAKTDDLQTVTSKNREDTKSEQPMVALKQITLEVSCEIGSVNLSLKELSELKIGDSIEFIKWPGKVKLFLNKMLFAEGYLVEINGMLGVKIANKVNGLSVGAETS